MKIKSYMFIALAAVTIASFAGATTIVNAAVSLDDPSDKPIQPGAPVGLHGGSTYGTPLGVCTMNFVFKDASNTYIGDAGHCTKELGEREIAPGVGEFGTTVFRMSCRVTPCDGQPESDDFALIRVDADKVGLVSPVMRGVGAAPTGFTTSDDTTQGDLVALHTQGLPGGPVPATRTQTGVFVSDDDTFWDSTLVGLTDSGSPVMHVKDGKALGIVTTGDDYGDAGPTVERMLLLLHEGGFHVHLVTGSELSQQPAAVRARKSDRGAPKSIVLGAQAKLAVTGVRDHFVASILLLSVAAVIRLSLKQQPSTS